MRLKDGSCMNRADQEVSNYRRKLENQYGFVADPDLPLWKNVENRLSQLTTAGAPNGNSIKNLACHNICRHNQPPIGYDDLLGRGLNYCIKPPSTTKSMTKSTRYSMGTFKRFRNDVRRLYAFRNEPPLDRPYNPRMYFKSEYEFKPCEDMPELEQALTNFERAFNSEQLAANQRQKPLPNLTANQHQVMQLLRNNDKLHVIPADKTGQPVLIDREDYTRAGCQEHLGDETTYKRITERQARLILMKMRYKLKEWLHRYRDDIPNEEKSFLIQSIKRYCDKFARFRMTAKLHKQKPFPPMRPIVCCVGTFMNSWSIWLDSQLSKLTGHVASFVKDYQQILDETRDLQLPPNARLCVGDANSMYTHIELEHAMRVISWWLDDLQQQNLLPEGFPLEAVKRAMEHIMRNNVFEFGDMHFLQLIGTAMGTSAAVMFATIYFAYHKATCILPKYGKHLHYY